MNVTNLSFIGQDFLLHNYSCKAIRQWGSQTVFDPSFLSIRCLYSLSFRSFSPLVFNVVHITQSSVFCILVRGLLTIVCFFVLFLLAIVQSVCYTASKYVFGIFKRLCKGLYQLIVLLASSWLNWSWYFLLFKVIVTSMLTIPICLVLSPQSNALHFGTDMIY
jgi:hypothetical protein